MHIFTKKNNKENLANLEKLPKILNINGYKIIKTEIVSGKNKNIYRDLEINKNGGIDFKGKQIIKGVLSYGGMGINEINKEIIDSVHVLHIFDLSWINKMIVSVNGADSYIIYYPSGKISERMFFEKWSGPEDVLAVSQNGNYIITISFGDEGIQRFNLVDLNKEKIIGNNMIEYNEQYKDLKFINDKEIEFDYFTDGRFIKHRFEKIEEFFKE